MSNIQITKQTVSAKPRKLNATWTFEQYRDEDLVAEIAKQIQEDIDRQILWDIRKTNGWKEVKLQYPTYGKIKHKINKWCSENLKGSFEGYRGNWIFELPEEATWFTLRWFEQENTK